MDIYHIIKRPLVTEKAMREQGELNRYAFEVERKADKEEICRAVEQLYKVHVVGINTAVIRGKMRRVGRNTGKKPNWKKAWVTLKEGEKIEIFEGV